MKIAMIQLSGGSGDKAADIALAREKVLEAAAREAGVYLIAGSLLLPTYYGRRRCGRAAA